MVEDQTPDLRIYNRALSEKDVKALYDFEKPKGQLDTTRSRALTPAPERVRRRRGRVPNLLWSTWKLIMQGHLAG